MSRGSIADNAISWREKAMSSRVDEIIQQVKLLPPSELNELRQLLQTIMDTATAAKPESVMTEHEFEQQMASRGFLRRALPPVTNLPLYQNHQPVEVQGQPLSEMIVEERR
jgi:hypothetical protein